MCVSAEETGGYTFYSFILSLFHSFIPSFFHFFIHPYYWFSALLRPFSL